MIALRTTRKHPPFVAAGAPLPLLLSLPLPLLLLLAWSPLDVADAAATPAIWGSPVPDYANILLSGKLNGVKSGLLNQIEALIICLECRNFKQKKS